MLVKSQVKYIQSLSHKKFRDEQNAFVAEGPKLVEELINNSPTSVIALYATPEWIAPGGVPCTSVNEETLKTISFQVHPNQVLGIFRKPDFDSSIQHDRLLLMLDALQDPGNLGTIIRTADWFGITRIICSRDTADVFNPKVVQATMGSIARVQLEYVDDLVGFLGQHPEWPSYATVPNAATAVNPRDIERGIVIIGNESRGIHPALLSAANHSISIAGRGKAESLNAAVATGIVLSMIGAAG